MKSLALWPVIGGLLITPYAIAEERGQTIAEEADRRANAQVETLAAEATMTLQQKGGRSSVREMTMRVLAGEQGDRTRIDLTEPADLAGTVLITHSHTDRVEDQWLYLPAVRRVRRLSGGGRAGSFLGSEFAYEDFAPQEVTRFEHQYVRDDQIDGQAVFVVERRPLDKQSGYSRQILWVDQAEYRLLRVDYHDRRDKHFKTLLNSEFELIDERYWRPKLSTMRHLASERTTHLAWRNFQFNQGLESDLFEAGELR